MSSSRSESRDVVYTVSQFYEKVPNLLDYLLHLADTLFVKSPSDIEKHKFQKELIAVIPVLNQGTVEAANEAASSIKVIKETHEKRMQQLQQTGYYDRDTFCAFWSLWRLLDETVRHPAFPESNYEEITAQLYGTLSSALQSRESVTGLYQLREVIFSDDESVPKLST